MAMSLLIPVVMLGTVFSATAVDERPLVMTEHGPVKGIWRRGRVAAFYKVPYARDTSGSRRWRPAMSPSPWKEPIDVTSPLGEHGACLQMGILKSSIKKTYNALKSSVPNLVQTVGVEDCLFAMIYTPRLPTSAAAATQEQNLPVFVWLHGGKFTMGDAWGLGEDDGTVLASRFDMVVVSLQYRLGPLGFFSLEALSAESTDGTRGNQGLQDQRFGLQWVQRNIARFGGDPSSVTIGGQSAGGISVCWHLASPMSRGLFHGAITESGGCDSNNMMHTAELHAETMANALGCPAGVDQLPCLRGKSGAAFLNTSVPGIFWMLANSYPVVDGAASGLPDTQLRLLRSGHGSQVPWLIGHNTDEFFLDCRKGQDLRDCAVTNIYITIVGLQRGAPLDSSFSRRAIEWNRKSRFGSNGRFTDEQWAKVLSRYPLWDYNNSQILRLSRMVTDFDFEGDAGEGGVLLTTGGQCATLRAASANVAAGAQTFVYQFDYHSDIGPGTMKTAGDPQLVQHDDEERFVFESLNITKDNRVARMAHVLGKYWSTFIKTGTPNSHKEQVFWPEFGATGEHLRFPSEKPLSEVPSRIPFCQFWQTLMVGHPVPWETLATLIM